MYEKSLLYFWVILQYLLFIRYLQTLLFPGAVYSVNEPVFSKVGDIGTMEDSSSITFKKKDGSCFNVNTWESFSEKSNQTSTNIRQNTAISLG